MNTKSVALAALALAASGLSARAQVTEPRESIAYQGARTIVETCASMAIAKHWPIAIWVLDVTGQPVYFASTPGTSEIGVTTAKFKAETALRTGAPSGARAASLATPVGQRTTQAIGLFPVDGGIPLMANGKVIGAVGAGGGRPENGQSVDLICAQAGVDAVFKK
jgi:glc operon protein GlcG